MRLVSALLFVALTGSFAAADDAKPADPKPESAATSRPRVPLRVVRMLPESKQVLLFDKNRGTHVVAEVGQDVDGYIVDEIADDEVTLVAGTGAEIILTAPDMTWRRKAAERRATAHKAVAAGDAPAAAPAMAPIDPYADADALATTAAPIAAGDGGVRVTSATGAPVAAPADPYAPADAYAPGVAELADALGAAPTASPTPAAPAAPAPKADAKVDAASSLAAAATGSPAPAAAAAISPNAPAPGVTVSRSDIDTALADFGATAVTVDAAFVADGLRFDQIAKGTILAKIGLEKGDVLTAVDNQPLHSLDDAANLYARAGTAKTATLHVLRAGKPTTLKVTIR
jgi:membrane-associated protease RseP (regulator of RpoE activity)